MRPAYITTTREATAETIDEIVRDEQDRHVTLAALLVEEPQDLRLHRDVERGRRLVGDQEVGIGAKRRGDHHALSETAGKLEGIGARALLRIGNANVAQQLDHSRVRRRRRQAAMLTQRFDDLRADPACRIEHLLRLLEHHADAPAADRVHRARRQGREILAVQPDGRRTPRECGPAADP